MQTRAAEPPRQLSLRSDFMHPASLCLQPKLQEHRSLTPCPLICQERMVLIDQGSPVKGAKKTAAVVKAVVKPDPPPPTPPPSYADLLAREQKGL
jgi:hypothetical protein